MIVGRLRRAMAIIDRVNFWVPIWPFERFAALFILEVVEDCCAFVNFEPTSGGCRISVFAVMGTK